MSDTEPTVPPLTPPPIVATVVPLAPLTLDQLRGHIQTILKWVSWAVSLTPASWGLQSACNVALAVVADDDAMNFCLTGVNMLRAEGLDLQQAEQKVIAYIKDEFEFHPSPAKAA